MDGCMMMLVLSCAKRERPVFFAPPRDATTRLRRSLGTLLQLKYEPRLWRGLMAIRIGETRLVDDGGGGVYTAKIHCPRQPRTPPHRNIRSLTWRTAAKCGRGEEHASTLDGHLG